MQNSIKLNSTELNSTKNGLDSIEHYDYVLPEHLIASRPMEDRTDARLVVVDRKSGTISHRHVRDLPEFLTPKDCLVLNDTKVVPARLKGTRTLTGGAWEGLFLEPASDADLDGEGFHFDKYPRKFQRWHILGTTRGKLQPGEQVTLLDAWSRPCFRLLMEKKLPADGSWICLPLRDGVPCGTEVGKSGTENDGGSCWDLLQEVGSVPIPPYIRKGVSDERDVENYQTVYAAQPGAVAAPTAGLHFTQKLLDEIQAKGVRREFVTLHVGLGTFRPIAVENLSEHTMHKEWGCLTPEVSASLRECRANGGRIVTVGTTSVRVLEASDDLKPFSGNIDLFIRPPYQFHGVDALMTNFHLPKSTLLVLVRTFGGDELLKRAYEEAIANEYRFYSYGDAMLIL